MEPQQELTLGESIKQVMRTLPPVIRNYLAEGKYSAVAKNLMFKYQLHVDQGTILEREIMLLLMGIENPDEFVQALAGEAKLDTQTINSITKDVNDQIFVPLRDQMRHGAPPAPAKPTTPPPPRYEVPASTPPAPPTPVPPPSQSFPDVPEWKPPPPKDILPKGMYAPPPQSPRYPSAEPIDGSLSAYIRQVPRPQSINRIQQPLRTSAPVPPPNQPTPPAPMPISGEKLLEDHEEPSPSLGAVENPAPVEVAPPPTSKPVGGAPRAWMSVAPARNTPPANLPAQAGLPGTEAPKEGSVIIDNPEPIRDWQTQKRPITPSARPTPQSNPTPKPYSADPYREPIDEKESGLW